jgi:hypothetical protein
MKVLFVTTLFVISVVISLAGIGLVSPYYYYNEFVNNNYSNSWYGLKAYNKKHLRPSENLELKVSEAKNEGLWKKFQFGDLQVPLPVRNPFYFVTPKLKFNQKSKRTDFGVSINNPEGRSLIDVYYLPNQSFPNFLGNQDLFRIPVVENHIKQQSQDDIWKDVFTRDVSNWNIPFADMVYNLYLLEFRSKILGKQLDNFGFYPELQMAFIELKYFNKDYKYELILKKRGNQIFSFILLTDTTNPSAKILRYKLINEIEYIESVPTLTDIIYKEYKALRYQDKIDHTGMLYLLSAWSHRPDKVNIIQEAIGNLEKGKRNQKVLESLYVYMFKRFGKVYSTRHVKGIHLESEVLLKRNIEIERIAKEIEAKKRKEDEVIIPIRTTIEEDYESIIKRAKKVKGNQGTIDLD